MKKTIVFLLVCLFSSPAVAGEDVYLKKATLMAIKDKQKRKCDGVYTLTITIRGKQQATSWSCLDKPGKRKSSATQKSKG